MAKKIARRQGKKNGDPTASAVSTSTDDLLLAALEKGSDTEKTGRFLVTFKEGATEAGSRSLESESGMRLANARDFQNQAVDLRRGASRRAGCRRATSAATGSELRFWIPVSIWATPSSPDERSSPTRSWASQYRTFTAMALTRPARLVGHRRRRVPSSVMALVSGRRSSLGRY